MIKRKRKLNKQALVAGVPVDHPVMQTLIRVHGIKLAIQMWLDAAAKGTSWIPNHAADCSSIVIWHETSYRKEWQEANRA